MECMANETLMNCGCVKFSMPRNSSHPVCGVKNYLNCLNPIERSRKSLQIVMKMNPLAAISKRKSCFNSCLPECISIKYKAELEHQVPYEHGLSDKRSTKITFKFDEDVFNALKLSELYTWTDFIANCGGILGFFIGISILSLMEIVYFFTLRLWTNLKARRRIQQE
ncbi:degenerin-like protein asic-1 isoform X1 [Episyrphus balteatus]|uniref:degenerin-like protein asic-1 isoform X1 n=2 Tax=Episyrphus balteatus TaxID=286459 RepID=UPI002485D2AE|nr:degenerin-like protein asic-1 isoform X1 [Episyrphus balteatus]